jgi:hypothetical protein
MIKIKEPIRAFASIALGAIAFYYGTEAGIAFFVGVFVGSFNLE